MIDVICHWCNERPRNIDTHLKFECRVINDRRGPDRPTDEEFWGVREDQLARLAFRAAPQIGPMMEVMAAKNLG